ncbi:LysR family transcriptional regulator [Solirubrobacter soli]|uniref:LysR family transcriptional regulator n=1 Tax=Solirubrobacter soli TaxID=363832 RepID=UPI00041E5DDA|nr:LysR family transcriptional regulator [Solirubrobacter soli]
MLDARWLRTLAAVVEHGSFGGAAAALGYTQSAVSQQISELERAVGLTLLERRPVRPTAAGEVALNAARHAGAVLDAAATELRALRDGTSATVRIGAFRTAAEHIVAPALKTFRDVHVSISQLETRDAYDALIAGELDLAVTFEDRPGGVPLPPPIRLRRLMTDAVLVALPDDHPLAAKPRLAPSDLVDERWIDAPDASVSPTLARILPVRTRGAAYDGDDFAVVLALVAAGQGIALVAGLAAQQLPPGVVTRPLAAPGLDRDINLARLDLQTVPPAVAALEAHLTATHRTEKRSPM